MASGCSSAATRPQSGAPCARRRGCARGRQLDPIAGYNASGQPRFSAELLTEPATRRVAYERERRATPRAGRVCDLARTPPNPDDTARIAGARPGQPGGLSVRPATVHSTSTNVAPSRRFVLVHRSVFRQPSHTRSPHGTEEKPRRALTIGNARQFTRREPGRTFFSRTSPIAQARATLSRGARERRAPSWKTERTAWCRAPSTNKPTRRAFRQMGGGVGVQRFGRAGGYRDIRIVDREQRLLLRADARFARSTSKPPSGRPTERPLYFVSDRTGIANVYAYDLLAIRFDAASGPTCSRARTCRRSLGSERPNARVHRLPLRRLRSLRAPARPARRPFFRAVAAPDDSRRLPSNRV